MNINLDNYCYEDNNGITYFKTEVSDETCFRKNKDKTANTTPDENSKYNCKILLQIQSVYYSNKDVVEDIDYYPQVFPEECRYTYFVNNKLIHDVLDFTDSEPDSESEAEEEEFNGDIM